MVNRILNFIHKEVSGLHEAAYLLGVSALLSQILGLVRDRLLASNFGAGLQLDIYYAAFRIPDFLFVSVASLVSMAVLIPFLIEELASDRKKGQRFVSMIFTVYSALIIAASVIAFFLIPKLTVWLFPGLVAVGVLDELVYLTRILLLSPILLGISGILGGIVQVYSRFFLYALSPIVYNFGIIIGILFLAPIYGIYGVVYGVIIGASLHLLIQVPYVIEQKLLPKFTFSIDWKLIKKVIIHSLPRAITVSSNEIARLVLVGLASLMAAGSISVFTFSFNLHAVPLTIIGVSYSLAAFPMLSKYYAAGNKRKFLEQIAASVRHIIFLSLPLVALFIVLRAQIVRTILGSGAFDWSDTRLTAAALAIFMVSLIPQSIMLLFVRAHYSAGNTKRPLIINAISSLIIIVLGFVLVRFFENLPAFRGLIEKAFRVEGIDGTEVLMIPLAYSIGAFVGLVMHWTAFSKMYGTIINFIRRSVAHAVIASFVMGVISYLALGTLDNFFDLNTFVGIFSQGFLAGIIGITAGVVSLKLLKNEEIGEIWLALHKKFWKAKVIGPDPEVG